MPRYPSARIARRQEIRDPVAVALEPVRRQPREPAAVELDDRLAAGPRAQHRLGAGAATAGRADRAFPVAEVVAEPFLEVVVRVRVGPQVEVDGQPVVVNRDRRSEVAPELEVPMTPADHLHGGRLETTGELDRLAGGQPRDDSGTQTELRAQAGDHLVLGGLHPDRDLAAAEVHELSRVDARDGRVAVDQGRQDREPIPVPVDLDPDPGAFAAASRRELRALDHERNPLLEIRDDFGHEDGEVVVREETAARQVRELAARELVGRERMERVAGLNDAVPEGLHDPRVLLHEEPDAGRGIDDLRDEPDRLRIDLDRPAVEGHPIGAGELLDQVGHVRPRGGVGRS